MLMSFSVNALASLHVHDSESVSVSSILKADQTKNIPLERAADHCDDDCFIHCGVWHIVAALGASDFNANPSYVLNQQSWLSNQLDESRFNQRLWRPPVSRS